MARNKLSDLNNHLFVALERLNEDELTIEEIEIEERRVRAISSISKEIIKGAELTYKVAVSVSMGDIDNKLIPDNFKNNI